MFEFLNKILKTKKPEKKDTSAFGNQRRKAESATPKEPVQQESKPQEPEHKDKPTEQKPSHSGKLTYEEWRNYFPKILEYTADYFEKEIPGDEITDQDKLVFVSAEVYGRRYIDKIYLEISQASDGHMTLKINAGKRGSDRLVGHYFFEAGRTREEIVNFLRFPEMPDILDKTINDLDETF